MLDATRSPCLVDLSGVNSEQLVQKMLHGAQNLSSWCKQRKEISLSNTENHEETNYDNSRSVYCIRKFLLDVQCCDVHMIRGLWRSNTNNEHKLIAKLGLR